jgi:hypothetical protein
MLATAFQENWTRQQHETRQRLCQLREQGYRYITTHDDGDTWVGSEQSGLAISLLLEMGRFMGQVDVESV